MKKLFFASILISSSLSFADLQFPFQRKLSDADYATFKAVACSKNTADILAEVKKYDADLVLYKSLNSQLPNGGIKHFENLPLVPKELSEELGPEDHGVMLSKFDVRYKLPKNVIILAESTEPINLVHEFAHFLFQRSLGENAAEPINESRKLRFSEFNMVFKFEKFFQKYENLQSSRWRMEILETMQTFANDVYSYASILPQEEVLIETMLVTEAIACNSPLLGQERALKGLKYAYQNLKLIQKRSSQYYLAVDNYRSQILKDPKLGISFREVENTNEKLAVADASVLKMLGEVDKSIPLLVKADQIYQKRFPGKL